MLVLQRCLKRLEDDFENRCARDQNRLVVARQVATILSAGSVALVKGAHHLDLVAQKLQKCGESYDSLENGHPVMDSLWESADS